MRVSVFPTRCLSFTILILPPIVLALYIFIQFPHPPSALAIHPSLSSLPLDSPARTIYSEDFFGSEGEYAGLPYGRVRYWVLGPEKGEKVVLIHGLSVPAIMWTDMAPQLAASGYRVLVYDLYGRGYSDAPSIVYDAKLFTTQLALLLQWLNWDQVHLVGASMGGGIAASFASLFPHLVTGKVALIASAGIMEATDFSRTTKFMSSPLVVSLWETAPMRNYLQTLAENAANTSDHITQLVRVQSAHLPGYNYAIASSLRNGPLRGMEDAFAALSAPQFDVLLIWGTNDESVPYKYAARLQKLIPDAKLLTFEEGPSDLPLSPYSKTVSESVSSFLKRKQ